MKMVDFINTAKSAFPVLGPILDLNFDYSHQSLKDLESAIDTQYPLGHEPLNTTIVALGIYLGEVIIHSVKGAEWGVPKSGDESNPFTWIITIPVGENPESKFVAIPLQRVTNYWYDRTDTLYGYCSMLRDMALGLFNPNTSTGYTGDGYTYKVKEPTPEELIKAKECFGLDK